MSAGVWLEALQGNLEHLLFVDQQRQVSLVGVSSAKQKHSFSGRSLFLGQFVSFGAPYGFMKIANVEYSHDAWGLHRLFFPTDHVQLIN